MIKWALTFILFCIALLAIVMENYVWFKYFLREIAGKEININKSFWVASGLSFVVGTALIGILLLWNPLAKNLLDVLLILNVIISLFFGESLVSPTRLSRWWRNRLTKKRKG